MESKFHIDFNAMEQSLEKPIATSQEISGLF
jgi:hypothetical protein